MLDALHAARAALRDELAPLAVSHLDAASLDAPAGNMTALTAIATARDYADCGDFDQAERFVTKASDAA